MKKFAAMGLALFSAVAFANSPAEEIKQGTVQPTEQAQKNSPRAMIHVFDISKANKPKLIEGTKLSRSKPRHLCIFIANVEIKDQNQFTFFFKTPHPTQINFEGAEVKVSEDKTEFLILSQVKKEAINNNLVTQCFTFSKNDPLGKYDLELQFNNVVFKGLQFHILK